MYPKPIKFRFYEDSMKFVGKFSCVMRLAAFLARVLFKIFLRAPFGSHFRVCPFSNISFAFLIFNSHVGASL